MHCFLRRQHSDRETDKEAIKTVIYGPLTSDLAVLLNVVDMHGVESHKRCFCVNEKKIPLVTYFVFCSSRSYTQRITCRYFMLSFYILLLSSLKISAKKYFFKVNVMRNLISKMLKRFENLPVCSYLYKNNALKISHP